MQTSIYLSVHALCPSTDSIWLYISGYAINVFTLNEMCLVNFFNQHTYITMQMYVCFADESFFSIQMSVLKVIYYYYTELSWLPHVFLERLLLSQFLFLYLRATGWTIALAVTQYMLSIPWSDGVSHCMAKVWHSFVVYTQIQIGTFSSYKNKPINKKKKKKAENIK